MKKKKFNKILFGEIRYSFSRFISIFAIVALGVGFLAGLGATTPDMRESVDAFYDEYAFHDIRVVSTLGLTDGDIEALRNAWGDEKSVVVEGAYSSDVVITSDGGDEFVTRFLSLGENVNLGRLVEGRMPEKSGECLVVLDDVNNYIVTGDSFTVNGWDADSALVCGEYTIVGIIDVPMYMSIEKDTTKLGSGKIAQMMYIPPDGFNIDAYTDIYARFDSAEVLTSFGTAYDELIGELTAKAETIADARSQARIDELTANGRAEIDDARAKLEEERAKAESELADGEAELDAAETDIADAKKALADGETEISANELKLSDARIQIADAEKTLADGETALENAISEYEAAKKTLQESELELVSGEQAYTEGADKLEKAHLQLADGEAALVSGRTEYEQNLSAYNDGSAAYETGLAEYKLKLAEYDAGNAAYETGKKDYESGLSAYNEAYSEYESSRSALEAAAGIMPDAAYKQAMAELESVGAALAAKKAELDTAAASIAANEAELETAKAQLDGVKTQLDETAAQLEDAKAQLDAANEQLTAAGKKLSDLRIELEAGTAELADNRAQLDEGWKKLNNGKLELGEGETSLNLSRAQLDEGRAELETKKSELADAEKALADGRAELDTNRQKLADAEAKLAEGRQTLADSRAEADAKLADAEAEIKKAEDNIASLEAPVWYVLDRNSNMSYVSFDSNAEKIGAIAKVFPIFFFLVAALVALTTMTRMVEEERGQIGTLKTLGYSNSAIMMKYVVYSGTASICGSAAGLAVGFKLFPTVIWKAYDIMYILPKLLTPFRWDSAVMITGVAVLCTVGAAVAAAWATVRETPASLMRPRSPKAGRRVFLENIAPLWKRMTFTHKVTARNLIRYKKRFFMTVIGIAGCTALLVTGFGLRDSIGDIVHKQYSEIETYNLTIRLSDVNIDEALEKILEDTTVISSYLPVMQQSVDIIIDGGVHSVHLRVPAKMDSFGAFITMQNRKTGESVPFDASSAVLTEKMAETLGVSAGDTLVIDDGDRKFEVTLTGVCENYIYSYLYIAPEVYSKAAGTDAAANILLANANAEDSSSEAEISAELLKSESVSSAYFTADTGRTFDDMLSKIDYIIIVLIISAGLLAVVVLYNLTNINITERTKELATIKVLGFYDSEVAAYIYRENVVLTVIGCAVGLVFGMALHIFVVKTAEVDMVMFGREIGAFSYLISIVMTLLFSALVNVIMLKRLRDIDMVESMKAE